MVYHYPSFLSTLRSRIHHSIVSLGKSSADGAIQVDSLCIWQPCKFFRTRVVLPVFTAANLNSVQTEIRNYVHALMNARRSGLNFLQVYLGQFFTVSSLRPLLSNHSWEMPLGFDPMIKDKLLFNIYSFLKCLRGYKTHPTLLPSAGLDILLSDCLARFVYMRFHSMDIEAGLKLTKFDASLLGDRLCQWMSLLDISEVQALWRQDGRTMRFQILEAF